MSPLFFEGFDFRRRFAERAALLFEEFALFLVCRPMLLADRFLDGRRRPDPPRFADFGAKRHFEPVLDRLREREALDDDRLFPRAFRRVSLPNGVTGFDGTWSVLLLLSMMLEDTGTGPLCVRMVGLQRPF
ncbi:unnamed protein product [Dicrocoelium dendriticum]|nr:unnamed protein product [Dicrocoelium dendriticum]